jgi:hypothetical protein
MFKQAELAAALEEVEALRTARHRQTELVDAIVRQRDMFKALYTEAMVTSGKDPQVCKFKLIFFPPVSEMKTKHKASSMVVMAELTSPSRTALTTPAPSNLATQLSTQHSESDNALRQQQQQQQQQHQREQHELLQQLQASFEAFRAEREATDAASRQVLFFN